MALTKPAGPAPNSVIAELFPAQGEWSEEEYFALPDTNRIVELSDGNVEMVEMPTDPHQSVVGQLIYFLKAHLKVHRQGHLRPAPLPVRLWPGKIREPDLVFMAAGHEDRITAEYWGVPDLVIEVHSPGTRRLDRIIKKQEYAQAGILEYWMVDFEAATIEVYRLEEAAYQLAGKYGPGDVLASPTLPGLALAIAEVFAEVRR